MSYLIFRIFFLIEFPFIEQIDKMIPELRQKLDEFKSWINEPRLYIVTELDATKNEIDIFAERFHMRANKSKTKSDEQKAKDHDKINSNRRQMIDEVETFQKKILAQMPTNELDAELSKKLAISVEELDNKLQNIEKELKSQPNKNVFTESSDLEIVIDSAIYEFDCAIKQKSSLLFVNVFLLKKTLNYLIRKIKFDSEFAIRRAQKFDIKLPVSEMELDEKDRDEDEVEFNHPNSYFQLDAATMFGILIILDDCISKEEIA